MTQPLLDVRRLKKHFPIKKGILSRPVGHVKAVDDVTFSVSPGRFWESWAKAAAARRRSAGAC